MNYWYMSLSKISYVINSLCPYCRFEFSKTCIIVDFVVLLDGNDIYFMHLILNRWRDGSGISREVLKKFETAEVEEEDQISILLMGSLLEEEEQHVPGRCGAVTTEFGIINLA